MTTGNDKAFGDKTISTSVVEGEFESTAMSDGLTKREYFAAIAMQGILAGQDIDLDTEWNATALGQSAVDLAEGLIQALNAPRRNA